MQMTVSITDIEKALKSSEMIGQSVRITGATTTSSGGIKLFFEREEEGDD